MSTPGFLRGEAVKQVIAAIHQASGTWALETAETYSGITSLTFAVGYIVPDAPDERERVMIDVQEKRGV